MGAGMSQQIDPTDFAKIMLLSNVAEGSGLSIGQMAKVSAGNNPITGLLLNQSMSQLNSIGQAATRSLYELNQDKNLSGSIPPKCAGIGYFDPKKCGDIVRCISKEDCDKLGGRYVRENGCLYVDSNNRDQAHNGDCAQQNIVDVIMLHQFILNDVIKYQTLAPSLDNRVLNTQIVDLRSRLAKAGELKSLITKGNTFNITVWRAFHYWAMLALYIVGPIFAAILITNAFYYNVNAKVPNGIFWVYKLFYAFWAALWYPAVLLYGAIDPPVFRAIFPFFGTSDPTASPMPIFGFRIPSGADDPVMAEKGRLLFRLFSMLLFAFFLYAYVFYNGTTPP
jgi:hypothetical protein